MGRFGAGFGQHAGDLRFQLLPLLRTLAYARHQLHRLTGFQLQQRGCNRFEQAFSFPRNHQVLLERRRALMERVAWFLIMQRRKLLAALHPGMEASGFHLDIANSAAALQLFAD